MKVAGFGRDVGRQRAHIRGQGVESGVTAVEAGAFDLDERTEDEEIPDDPAETEWARPPRISENRQELQEFAEGDVGGQGQGYFPPSRSYA